MTTDTATIEVGDTVRVNEQHPFLTGTQGTVIRVKDHPAGGKVAVFREVNGEPEYHELPVDELDKVAKDKREYLDLDHLPAVVQELRDIAASTSEFTSLDSSDRHQRLFALARIVFLAGRAQWLETTQHISDRRNAEMDMATAAKRDRAGGERGEHPPYQCPGCNAEMSPESRNWFCDGCFAAATKAF